MQHTCFHLQTSRLLRGVWLCSCVSGSCFRMFVLKRDPTYFIHRRENSSMSRDFMAFAEIP